MHPILTMNNDINGIYEEFNSIKEQLRQELDNLKGEITQFIKEEAPLKADLDLIKAENKSIKGKIEFLKKVLREFNPDIYKKVINEVFK